MAHATDRIFRTGTTVPDCGVEQTAAQINVLLLHFGEDTPLAISLRTSYEHLVLEVGIGENIFTRDYGRYKYMATKSWMKSLWEGAHKHGAAITIKNAGIYYPYDEQMTRT